MAYVALKAWKHAITADPKNITGDWSGPLVCNYTGVYCTEALDNPSQITVAGIDLNRGALQGTLPVELGLLSDLALLHLNSNAFRGTLPASLKNLRLLYELDVSNNHLGGGFPSVVLELPSLRFLDIRFNRFCGDVPSCLFHALFFNDNHFTFSIPENIGNLPGTIGGMTSLEQLDVAHNELSGEIPSSICDLPQLKNFTYSYNYFFKEPARCLSIRSHDDRENCFPLRPLQRPPAQCPAFLSKPNSCDSNGCINCLCSSLIRMRTIDDQS